MKLWTWHRWSTLTILTGLVALLLSFSIPSSVNFYLWLFGDITIAVGFMLVVDVVCLVTYCMNLAGLHTRISFLHHILPVVSAVPLYHTFYVLAVAQLEGHWPVVVSVVATTVITALAYMVYKSIEDLFVDPITLAQERAEYHMRGLLTVRTQYDAMKIKMLELTNEAQQLTDDTTRQVLLSDGNMTRERFRVSFNVSHKNLTEAYSLYNRGKDFEHLCKKVNGS